MSILHPVFTPPPEQHRLPRRGACAVVVLLAAVAVVSSCASTGPKPQRGSLTEAAEQAAKDEDEKQKVMQNQPQEVPDTTIAFSEESSLTVSQPAEGPETSPSNAGIRNTFSFVGGGGSVQTSQFDGFGAMGLGAGMIHKRHRLDVIGFYMTTNLTEESGVVQALVNEHEWALDTRYRFSFTPTHTFAGLYGVAGMRFGRLSWDYKNGVPAEDENGDPITIEQDHLSYFGGYVGLGAALVQTDHVLLGVDFSVGFKDYSDSTNEGFDQDLFDSPTGFGQLLFSLDWRLEAPR